MKKNWFISFTVTVQCWGWGGGGVEGMLLQESFSIFINECSNVNVLRGRSICYQKALAMEMGLEP